MAISYGLGGVSWWSWQETNRHEWRALGRDVDGGVAGVHRSGSDYPALSKGSRGDLVVWAQEHLKGAGESVPVTGYFGYKTRRAVKRFQASKGFVADGHIGAKTWHALLEVAPKTVDWSSRGSRQVARLSAVGSAPRSASLPARRDEIPPASRR
jgi:peptidoglycan hydrolase-like protein with peptidoglycan-binding domain